ncbi:iron-containing redox enzyme family protein [Acinetobacter calcoaceticus]|uniref:iron-containing redox enzyme family protein n=1 Tax=Acinetobacter calcoaceticus TaxID=471 RepID=UPI00300983FB
MDNSLEMNDLPNEVKNLDSIKLLKLPTQESLSILKKFNNLNDFFNININFKNEYLKLIKNRIEDAFVKKYNNANYEIHSILYQLYNLQISDPLSKEAINQHQPFFYEIRNLIEDHWLNSLHLDYVLMVKDSDKSISELIMELCEREKISEHTLFSFLATEANERQLFAFFKSDYELNIRFFDVLIFTLLNSPNITRMEMIKNLWDESGRGNYKETHVNMFEDLVNNFNVTNKNNIVPHDSWQKLAGYNLFMLASLNRKNYYTLLGIMAATEAIDPQSYIKVQEACKRNNMTEWLYRYYSEHSELDIEHAKGWLNYVIEPIAKESDIKNDILFGTFSRLKTCKDYYDSLYQYLQSIK